jgi:hypothetical protein
MTFHLIPENDEHEHVEDPGGMCPCLPVRDATPGLADTLWLHNSYDGRELREVVERALTMLGCALTEHGHHWSPKLRQQFEIASDLIARHMPNLVGYERLSDDDRAACKSAVRE